MNLRVAWRPSCMETRVPVGAHPTLRVPAWLPYPREATPAAAAYGTVIAFDVTPSTVTQTRSPLS